MYGLAVIASVPTLNICQILMRLSIKEMQFALIKSRVSNSDLLKGNIKVSFFFVMMIYGTKSYHKKVSIAKSLYFEVIACDNY